MQMQSIAARSPHIVGKMLQERLCDPLQGLLVCVSTKLRKPWQKVSMTQDIVTAASSVSMPPQAAHILRNIEAKHSEATTAHQHQFGRIQLNRGQPTAETTAFICNCDYAATHCAAALLAAGTQRQILTLLPLSPMRCTSRE